MQICEEGPPKYMEVIAWVIKNTNPSDNAWDDKSELPDKLKVFSLYIYQPQVVTL